MLFYREAIRRERMARADRIEDTAAGFVGGDKTLSFVRQLRR